MPRIFFALVTACLLAAPLHAKTLLFDATLTVDAVGVDAVSGSNIGVATINGSGGGTNITTLAFPGGLFDISSTVTPAGTTLPFSAVEFTVMLASGTVMATTPTGPLAGMIAVPGNVRVCIFLSCLVNVDVPLTQGGTRGVGIGGAPITLTGLVSVTLSGAAWGDQVVTLTTTTTSASSTSMFTAAGFAHGPLSNTGTTATAGGVLQLVTPVSINASGAGQGGAVPTFGILNIQFLPEPGLALLFGSGALGVALLGLRRR